MMEGDTTTLKLAMSTVRLWAVNALSSSLQQFWLLMADVLYVTLYVILDTGELLHGVCFNKSKNE